MYRCPLWETCTAHTDPETHICDHVKPHEWSYADGDECGWLEGECTEVCQPLGSVELICQAGLASDAMASVAFRRIKKRGKRCVIC